MVCHRFWSDHLIKSYHTNNFQWSWLAYTMGLIVSYSKHLILISSHKNLFKINQVWFLIGFHFISFFFKKIIKNVFLYGILSALLKKFWRYAPWKIQKKKKKKKCSKNVIIFSSNLNRIFGQKNVEIWISLFLYQKTSIPNWLKFWAASFGQNTKQVQKTTQIQHYLQFSLKISNEFNVKSV